MKTCDKCRRPSIETTRDNEELCIKHYSTEAEDEKPEPKKEVSINDYFIL